MVSTQIFCFRSHFNKTTLEQNDSRPLACLSCSSKHNLKHFEWRGAKFSPFGEHETLTVGLIVKHNVCLWSLRCQSSILTNTLLLLKPHCALLNGFVYLCVCVFCSVTEHGVMCESKKKTSVKMSLSSLCQPLMTQSKDRQYFMGLQLSAGLPLS